MILEVYTDGSCYKQLSIGGWGVYISFNNKQIQFSGSCTCKSSIAAELIAILKALEYIEFYIDDFDKIEIFTDCDFIAKIAQEYESKNKPTYRTKTALKYKHLVNQLFGYISMFDIKWNIVKSHRGIKGNEIADHLAKKAAKIRIEQEKGAKAPL